MERVNKLPKEQLRLLIIVNAKEHSGMIGAGGHAVRALSQNTGTTVSFPGKDAIYPKKHEVTILGRNLTGMEEVRRHMRRDLMVSFKVDNNQVKFPGKRFLTELEASVCANFKVSCKIITNSKGDMRISLQGTMSKPDKIKEAFAKVTQLLDIDGQELIITNCLNLPPLVQPTLKICADDRLKENQTDSLIQFTFPKVGNRQDDKIVISGNLSNVIEMRRHLLHALPVKLEFTISTGAPLDWPTFTGHCAALNVVANMNGVLEQPANPSKSVESHKQIILKTSEGNCMSLYFVHFLLFHGVGPCQFPMKSRSCARSNLVVGYQPLPKTGGVQTGIATLQPNASSGSVSGTPLNPSSSAVTEDGHGQRSPGRFDWNHGQMSANEQGGAIKNHAEFLQAHIPKQPVARARSYAQIAATAPPQSSPKPAAHLHEPTSRTLPVGSAAFHRCRQFAATDWQVLSSRERLESQIRVHLEEMHGKH